MAKSTLFVYFVAPAILPSSVLWHRHKNKKAKPRIIPTQGFSYKIILEYKKHVTKKPPVRFGAVGVTPFPLGGFLHLEKTNLCAVRFRRTLSLTSSLYLPYYIIYNEKEGCYLKQQKHQ